MSSLLTLTPWLGVMLVLVACSAFFSASEAALFFLGARQRKELRGGTPAEQVAWHLLERPERLLSAVLFWNLVVNIAYFAVASSCAVNLQRQSVAGGSAAVGFALLSLLIVIFFSEMMPKAVAVTRPRLVVRLVSLPLAVCVRVLDPVLGLLRGIMRVSHRLAWPGLRAEPEMEIADLQRAIALSGIDESLIKQEQAVLQNIVQLSEIRIDEWMRPRSQFRTLAATASLEDLDGSVPASGYVLLTEPGSHEIDRSVRLDSPGFVSEGPFADQSQEVVYLPWCATVADALQQLDQSERDVVAVVNEFGETIGIITREDILETVFVYNPSRIKRLLDQNPIHMISPGRWAVSGMMSLRRLRRHFHFPLPQSRSVTISGAIQEQLQRVARAGDTCQWGPFQFKVIEAPQRGTMLVELRQRDPGEGTP